MTDHRLRTMRFWHLAIGGLLAAWLWPTFGLWLFSTFAFAPLGLFMPVFATSCNALICSASSATYQVDTAGFTNDAFCSNCATYNGGWVLSPFNPGVDCCFRADLAAPYCLVGGLDPANNVEFCFSESGGNTRATVAFVEKDDAAASNLATFDDSIGAAPANCATLSAETLPRTQLSICNHDGTQTQVTSL